MAGKISNVLVAGVGGVVLFLSLNVRKCPKVKLSAIWKKWEQLFMMWGRKESFRNPQMEVTFIQGWLYQRGALVIWRYWQMTCWATRWIAGRWQEEHITAHTKQLSLPSPPDPAPPPPPPPPRPHVTYSSGWKLTVNPCHPLSPTSDRTTEGRNWEST